MTKSDLIERLCQEQKLPKGKAELLVNTIFDCLEQALRRGERIEIRGFGSFEIREYKAYKGRNPKTGVPVSVREKRLPFFKVGKELKERVNGRSPSPTPGSSNGHDQGRTPPSSSGSSGTSDSSGTSEAGAPFSDARPASAGD
jgi:integration host factor subunit beta